MMWTRVELKQNAKTAFQRNYWLCVVTCLLASFLGGEVYGGAVSFDFSNEEVEVPWDWAEIWNPTILVVFFCILGITIAIALAYSILVGNIITVGSCRFYMENRIHKTPIGQLFYGFGEGRYGNVVVTMLLRTLYLIGWYMLFLVPGVIKSYSYMMVPYILAENPQIDRKRAFELSRSMMDGHKMDAFVLELSFFGWILLGSLTGGLVSFLYVSPYMTATHAEFYTAIKSEAIYKGITNTSELPGVDDRIIEPEVVIEQE